MIEKAEDKEYYEVSSAQKRVYILQQFDKDSTAYWYYVKKKYN